ncbi:unnamed protein product [Rhizophagus irregularis]|nr:unnamed protein product [Rhizophagus irregularis]
METIIGISNSFFKLNNIRINGDKSELLVWNAPKDVIKSIKMGTNNDLVVAKKPSQESKYLGVYIKSQAGSSHIVKRVKNEIKSMVNLLKYKKITESQVVYVNNVVLMARLEYWLKCTFLTQNQCRTLHNCMILLLKQKMRITKSANNNIFTHQGLVGMTSLLQHLRTAQYADFIVRINSQEWDGISTRIILRNAQLRAGLAGCILTIEPSKLLQVNIPNNFNFNILKDIKDQLFNFDAINVDDWHLDILDTTILDFLLQPNYNHNNTRGQGQAILRPNQIKMTLGISAAGPLPYFTKYIIEQLLNALNRNIQHQDQTSRITADLTPSPRYQPIMPQHPSLDRRRKEWVIVNTNRLSEVGKIVEKNSVMTFLYQHWIIREGSDLLIKCAGCSTSSMNGQTSTGTCIRRGHFSKATVIKVEVLTKKIEEASFRIITPTNLIKRRTITSTAAFNNEQKLITVDIPLIDHNIILRFITSPLLAHELCDINSALQRENNNIFQIYTDGSLDLNCRNSRGEVVMGAGWIIKDQDLSFSCGVNYHPSSTRPELLAIMTALLAVPNNAKVAIYTDSQAAIEGINRMLDASYRINRRKFLKMNNYIILFAIYDFIKTKSLMLNLHKVCGHSGNRWNDMADEIAKQGRDAASYNNDRIIDIRLLHSFSFPLTFLPVWNNISINRHIRSFTRLVADSLEEVQWSFNKYWSSYFEETFTTSRWHWGLFWQYVNSLNKGHCLSFSTNDKFIHFIKCSNNLLPTIDNLRKRNELYNQVKCPMCLHDDEDI